MEEANLTRVTVGNRVASTVAMVGGWLSLLTLAVVLTGMPGPSLRAQDRQLFWLANPPCSSLALLDASDNLISAAIGEQGIPADTTGYSGENMTLALENLRRDQAGGYSVMASNSSGTAISAVTGLPGSELVIWGNPVFQKKGAPPAATNLVAVSTWEAHTIALRENGTVVVWAKGPNDYLDLAAPAGLSGVVAVAAGPGYNLALKADGQLTGWGWNYPALNIPPRLSNVVAIAAGHQYCLAVRSDGMLLAFGENERAQRIAAGGLDKVVAVAA